MKKALCKWLLNIAGWKIGSLGEDVSKCVICVAPHTSNWDFVIGKLFYGAVERKACFLIKKEWFFFPFNFLFGSMGGIPVDRRKNTSVTDQMAEEFAKRKTFHLAITPEGTRKKASDWKKGFYYIAVKAEVPILLAYIDYKKKEVGFGPLFHPTGDVDADIATIRSFYKGVTARFPSNFADT
ncbi:1-acyl-sn-glycerol-3-phosphate acyltransferase [Parabacteroides sp. PF5-5]|uniref:1-acyl-sn-glycerol-3-phosphate acyltransferase n=1 Tax=unclassified Parabacteroides TaxID=2649774 RepID=UPI002474D8C2|nr:MULTISPECIES: 1-acyl-sn-glycerol-3-phosphate acyltransferase [unclassified Parabacteroides]MDH6304227.1 1-acyl-sn-glycerol-3-phosphate acyltransferase [Parabacteroides sp. PH5-39]MDH6315058.1 1-acyl-sn-glycerol-3-phosphate acyltransferase [Parabacteroides sp. PF5-13]MDH6318718.1 1-acyl-sn-glycerol-3-phosphate acyltransferase [Parabacteroides sp. PH5-13]MDH6322448.1 1-acyl-sn-glycerol-3-phosphate acyltransferase [Parabacteroides sp. PH5-8]MDH6326417.1 1-acyl-sn-glycerol-3-phosphate acyltrans